MDHRTDHWRGRWIVIAAKMNRPIEKLDRIRSWIVRRAQIPLYAVGLLLVASGLVHIVVWISQGGSWEGDVSWRKPILFGLSAGATMLSLGWLVGKIRARRGDDWLFGAFSTAMFAEVALITMQQWRGVASHFNRDTPFDTSVLYGIEGLILFATVVIAELTRRSFLQLENNTPLDMRLAIRSGMALLLLACLLGFALVAHGNRQIADGLAPGIYGDRGVTKFPHGVPLHAIQLLPFVAWFWRVCGVTERQRFRSVALATLSIVLFTLFSIAQTLGGRARFETTLGVGRSFTFVGDSDDDFIVGQPDRTETEREALADRVKLGVSFQSPNDGSGNQRSTAPRHVSNAGERVLLNTDRNQSPAYRSAVNRIPSHRHRHRYSGEDGDNNDGDRCCCRFANTDL